MRYGRLYLIAAVPAVTAALLVSAGCAASGGTAGPAAAEPAAVAPEIDAAAREQLGPPPLTDAERAWLRAVVRYQARLERETGRSMTLTQASMGQLADLYGGCAMMLRNAGGPGRYAPVARIAGRACRRFTLAEEMLRTAMSVTDAGGAVVVGTPEEAIHERAIGGSFEAAGNGGNDLNRALERAASIRRQIDGVATIPRATQGA